MLIPSSGGLSEQFPAGLRVLVVDDDSLCLKILEKMLKKCLYEVTKCNRAEIALKYLRDNKNGFDIVISDVHMPDMDGFKLLEQVGLEMDLPVIMMSADDSKNVVMKGVTYGACDYLIKPVSMEALKNIWQHVIRKTKHELKDKDLGLNGCVEDGERKQKSEVDVDNNSIMESEENSKNLKKRKDEEEEEDEEYEDVGKDDKFASKKPRVVWSRELHLQFLAAVDHLGYEKAVPKRILEMMNVPGLTRENVASHLQKYRICLRKKYGDVSHNSSYMGPPDTNFGSISSFHGNNFQALPTNGFTGLSLAMLQSLVKPSNKSPISVMDQRNNPYRFESPVEPQLGGSNIDQMSLIQNSPLITPVTQPISRALMPSQHNGSSVSTHVSSLGQSILLNEVSNLGLTRSGTTAPVVDFSMSGEPPLYGNIFPNARNTGFLAQGESKGSKGFVNGYGYFDELQQYKTRGLQTVGSTIDVSHHALQGIVVPQSSFVQTNGQDTFFTYSNEGYQNGHSNFGLPHNDSFVTDKGSSFKSEILLDTSGPSNFFSQQYGSDDIFSELLKPVDELSSFEPGFGFDDYPSDNILA